MDTASLEKSLSPDQLAAATAAIEAAKTAQADLTKAWTFSNPSTQLVPYDLLPVVQLLVNRKTPLVDRIPTGPAEGTAHHYDQVTGWSNSGQGGVPNLLAGLNSDSISTAFGPINLRRGMQITYATTSGAVIMIEHGLSDQVDWGIGYAMEGLQDPRQLCHTGLLWASLGAKEREHLYGRGSSPATPEPSPLRPPSRCCGCGRVRRPATPPTSPPSTSTSAPTRARVIRWPRLWPSTAGLAALRATSST